MDKVYPRVHFESHPDNPSLPKHSSVLGRIEQTIRQMKALDYLGTLQNLDQSYTECGEENRPEVGTTSTKTLSAAECANQLLSYKCMLDTLRIGMHAGAPQLRTGYDDHDSGLVVLRHQVAVVKQTNDHNVLIDSRRVFEVRCRLYIFAILEALTYAPIHSSHHCSHVRT